MSLPPPIRWQLDHQLELLPLYTLGLAPVLLANPAIPGKWNAHQQIAHLASYQPKFIHRINAILERDNPLFERYRADDDPDFLSAVALSDQNLEDWLLSGRRELVLLLSGLSDLQWKRTGEHIAYGKMDIGDWVTFFLAHEAHHLFAVAVQCRLQQKAKEADKG